MPAYAIECGGLLQLREDFADKREDHVDTSLPANGEDTLNAGERQANGRYSTPIAGCHKVESCARMFGRKVGGVE